MEKVFLCRKTHCSGKVHYNVIIFLFKNTLFLFTVCFFSLFCRLQQKHLMRQQYIKKDMPAIFNYTGGQHFLAVEGMIMGWSFCTFITPASSSGCLGASLFSFCIFPQSTGVRQSSLHGLSVSKMYDGAEPRNPMLTRKKKFTIIIFLMFKD